MRSHGSFSSPTAHIAFCTLDDVLRPHILSIQFSRLRSMFVVVRDGRTCVVRSVLNSDQSASSAVQDLLIAFYCRKDVDAQVRPAHDVGGFPARLNPAAAPLRAA